MVKIVNINGKIYGLALIQGVKIIIEPKDNEPNNVQPALMYFLNNQ